MFRLRFWLPWRRLLRRLHVIVDWCTAATRRYHWEANAATVTDWTQGAAAVTAWAQTAAPVTDWTTTASASYTWSYQVEVIRECCC